MQISLQPVTAILTLKVFIPRFSVVFQAKILYNQGFTKGELVSFKCLIQANIYKYMAILLEGRERFEEEEDELANAPASREPHTSSVASLEDSNNSSSPQPGMILLH